MRCGFANEMTYGRMMRVGGGGEFHRKYEEALSSVRGMLGSHHPIYIGCGTYFSEVGSLKTDRHVTVGRFCGISREGYGNMRKWLWSGSTRTGAGGPYYLYQLMKGRGRSTFT
ncbi:MAG: hypothetical protein QW756_02350 [Nitrososphaerota archaeon]